MADKIRLRKSMDVDSPSDSEDEYSDTEKRLLGAVRGRGAQGQDSEEEALAFTDDDDDGEGEVADSDVERGPDDELPDPRAWGTRKRAFYSTDYVDEDYGGFGKEEEAARLEEQEARVLQDRLARQLGEEDFSLELLGQGGEPQGELPEESLIKVDPSRMSDRQKLQLFQREAPEFMGLTGDCKQKLKTAAVELRPLMELSAAGRLPACKAVEFVGVYCDLILNYCTNVTFYTSLKAARTDVQRHPVVERLCRYRQLLGRLDKLYQEQLQEQVQQILQAAQTQQLQPLPTNKQRQKLKLMGTLNKRKQAPEVQQEEEEEEVAAAAPVISQEVAVPEELAEQMVDAESGEKRAITYQMAKNKGLTPHRKKEQRNPRVKHRNKYRKAVMRRRGAVRSVRTETERYQGEISGIKSNVRKSISIK